jgi:catechol 2,3-dioxygenase-like lactoylglutathione lyase family enzyme
MLSFKVSPRLHIETAGVYFGSPRRRAFAYKQSGRRDSMQLTYAIKFVADMDRAIAFHRDVLGLSLRFQSPEWSEFETGQTTLALHPASTENPAGVVELGFATEDLAGFYDCRDSLGVEFTQPPRPMHGVEIARIRDPDGAETSVSGVS